MVPRKGFARTVLGGVSLLSLCALLAVVFAGACLHKSVPNRGVYCDDVDLGANSYGCKLGYRCDVGQNLCVPDTDAGAGDAGDDAGTPPDLSLECQSSASCGVATLPVCVSNACASCTTAPTECAAKSSSTPKCLAGTGACVECLTKDDCAAAKKTCTTSNMCGACANHTDCASGVCAGGECILAGDIAYVDNTNACPTPDGSVAMPYCDIQAGVNSDKAFVHVKGTPNNYGAVTILTSSADKTVTIIGPGWNATTPAKISPGIVTTGVSVTSTAGKTANVTIDGLDVQGITSPGVYCNGVVGTASITLKNSRIHASGDLGFDSSKCNVTLERNLVGPNNSAGGVRLQDGTYSLRNNIIFGNGTNTGATPGVAIQGTADGTFEFNTVSGNTVTNGGTSGVSCSIARTLSNSIIMGNVHGTTVGNQVSTCSYNVADVIVSGPVDFTSDYHLVASSANNAACCTNKVANGPARDVDGEARPKGAAYDIGADEVE